jgi:hypothetical protein
VYIHFDSRDSSVGIATGYRLGSPGSLPGSARFFYTPQRPDRPWGPPSLLPGGSRWLYPGRIKRPGREADYSPQSSAEVKKSGALLPRPHIPSWHCVHLIKDGNNFTFMYVHFYHRIMAGVITLIEFLLTSKGYNLPCVCASFLYLARAYFMIGLRALE